MEIKGLYKLTRQDEEKLILLYMDAFKYYPKLMNAFPDENDRAAALEATLRYYVAYDMEYGAAFSLNKNINEGTCIVYSKDMNYSRQRHEKAGSFSAKYKAAVARLTKEQQEKREALFDELDRLEKEIDLPSPHLYVDFLGVREEYQQQGRGRKLLGAICDFAASQELPIMLFTNTPEDVAFYESFGFQAVHVVKSDQFGFVNTYLIKEVS